MEIIEQNRKFMQCPNLSENKVESDQKKGLQKPDHSKAVSGAVIELPPFSNILTHPSYEEILDHRRSERRFADKPISQEQLAFLLWSAQGVQKFRGNNTLRTVPSGGARHPFELYFAAHRVENLEPAFYRYAPMENAGVKQVSIEFIRPFEDNYEEQMKAMLSGQSWAAKSAVVLLFSCVPYRAEWRYSHMAHRIALIDLGHIGQNAILSASALGLGACCIGAYNQELCNKTLGLNGIDEYMVYAITVGVVR
jgi:SagB-type dehydrogenase family enzyme